MVSGPINRLATKGGPGYASIWMTQCFRDSVLELRSFETLFVVLTFLLFSNFSCQVPPRCLRFTSQARSYYSATSAAEFRHHVCDSQLWQVLSRCIIHQ